LASEWNRRFRQFASLLERTVHDAGFRVEAGLNHLTIVLALGDPKSAAGLSISDLVES
jgi:arylformamidase